MEMQQTYFDANEVWQWAESFERQVELEDLSLIEEEYTEEVN